ncbi:Histone-lysine N-methyltransferase SETMAR, partial [Stegodyphus mimosarum]
MATGFWDQKSVLLVEFMQPGTTINADSYCETLRRLRRAIQNKRRGLLTSGIVLIHDNDSYCETLRRLRRAIQNKRRGLLTSGIVLIHDNDRPHSVRVTQRLLQQFQWDIFEHPPYSSDLAPSDFHLFPELKLWLGGKLFQNDVELKETVTTHFQSLAGTFFEEGIAKLVHRYDKCLTRQGVKPKNKFSFYIHDKIFYRHQPRTGLVDHISTTH